jgi:hypothetical protein
MRPALPLGQFILELFALSTGSHVSKTALSGPFGAVVGLVMDTAGIAYITALVAA